jgi:hypothetical protein
LLTYAKFQTLTDNKITNEDLVTDFIDKAYNYIDEKLDIEIQSDDTIKETRYKTLAKIKLPMALFIDSVSTITRTKQSDTDAITNYEHDDYNVYFYSESDNTVYSFESSPYWKYEITYSTKSYITDTLEKIAFDITLFETKQTPTEGNRAFEKTQNNRASDVSVQYVTSEEFYNEIDRRIMALTPVSFA